MQGNTDAINEVKVAVQGNTDAINDMRNDMKILIAATTRVAEAVEGMTSKIEGMTSKIEGMTSKIEGVASSVDRLVDEIRRGNGRPGGAQAQLGRATSRDGVKMNQRMDAGRDGPPHPRAAEAATG